MSVARRRMQGAVMRGVPVQVLQNVMNELLEITRRGSPIEIATNRVNRDRALGIGPPRAEVGRDQVEGDVVGMDESWGEGGTSSSKKRKMLSGKFKKGKSIKKIRKSPLEKLSVGGMNQTLEARGSARNVNCVTIGHSTMPRLQILDKALSAMLFKIFDYIGNAPISRTDPINLPAGTRIEFFYKVNAVSAEINTSAVFTFSGTPADNTIGNIITWFFDANAVTGRPWLNTTAADLEEFEFTKIVIPGNVNSQPMTLQVNEILIKGTVVSILKIQNRTLGAGAAPNNEEIDTVDAVPLIGKSFFGFGNGLRRKQPMSNKALYADQQYGLIGDQGMFSEPPKANQFTNAKSVAGIKMQPGEIKSSYLTDSFSMYFNTIFKLSSPFGPPYASGNLINVREKRTGKFRVFFIEKALQVFDGALENQVINVVYEHNWECSCKAFIRKKHVTMKDVGQVNLNPFV